jgi:hypothetical protein
MGDVISYTYTSRHVHVLIELSKSKVRAMPFV